MTATERLWRQAIAWQIALAAYMQVISWLPLGRWNYQPCCPVAIDRANRGALGALDALGLAAFLLIPVVFVLGRRKHRWLAWLSISAYGVWLALQLGTWWPPYLFGASERWSRVYARAFAESTSAPDIESSPWIWLLSPSLPSARDCCAERGVAEACQVQR